MNNSVLHALVIDDEQASREVLGILLSQYFEGQVQVLDFCEDLPSGVRAIRQHKPDVVFLDIEMPGHTGLELLDFLEEDEVTFGIIFVTAYSSYAVQAFRLSAIDYLLKPIQLDQLTEAITKVREDFQAQRNNRLKTLSQNMSGNLARRICIPSIEGDRYYNLNDILYFSADGGYSTIYFAQEPPLVIAKKLKYFEAILEKEAGFFRCHRSHIVNLLQIRRQDGKSSTSSLIMSNGQSIPVARERAAELESLLAKLIV